MFWVSLSHDALARGGDLVSHLVAVAGVFVFDLSVSESPSSTFSTDVPSS